MGMLSKSLRFYNEDTILLTINCYYNNNFRVYRRRTFLVMTYATIGALPMLDLNFVLDNVEDSSFF